MLTLREWKGNIRVAYCSIEIPRDLSAYGKISTMYAGAPISIFTLGVGTGLTVCQCVVSNIVPLKC